MEVTQSSVVHRRLSIEVGQANCMHIIIIKNNSMTTGIVYHYHLTERKDANLHNTRFLSVLSNTDENVKRYNTAETSYGR